MIIKMFEILRRERRAVGFRHTQHSHVKYANLAEVFLFTNVCIIFNAFIFTDKFKKIREKVRNYKIHKLEKC